MTEILFKIKQTPVFYLILLIVITFPACFSSQIQSKDQVCFKGKCINVEVVQKEEERSRGLQFRKSLDQNSGMLFIFPFSRDHTFWMKDTLISLDIIWIDQNHRVVHIASKVPPCKADPCPIYRPDQAALYVLEVNAGYTSRYGIKEGNVAEFRLN